MRQNQTYVYYHGEWIIPTEDEYDKIYNTVASLEVKTDSISMSVTQTQNELKTAEGRIDIAESNIDAKVSKVSDGAVEGFGWDLQSDKWTIYSESGDVSEGTDKKVIMTVDDTGMTLQGAIKISGYTKRTETRYCKLNTAITPDPLPSWWDTWVDSHWQNTIPTTTSGEFI